MNSDSVIKSFDVFKNQVVCVSVILNVKTVKPIKCQDLMYKKYYIKMYN